MVMIAVSIFKGKTVGSQLLSSCASYCSYVVLLFEFLGDNTAFKLVSCYIAPKCNFVFLVYLNTLNFLHSIS